MNKDEKALENFFETMATDLLSGLLDANDNEQNAHLKPGLTRHSMWFPNISSSMQR